MKQLLSLALALLPCLAWAQYPSNGNQKITLGEQTTADGLIWRGVAATDTVRKPSIDTMAYMVLDTTTNIIWHYKKATSNAWLRLNLLPSDTASFNYVNTYGTQTVNGAKTFTTAPTFSTALSVASGGTGRTTMPAGYILHGDGTSVDTAIGLFWQRNVNKLGINNNNPSGVLDVKGDIILNAGGVQFPIQLRNDFTPNIQRADLMFLGNSTSDNGFRWGSISSSGGVTFQATKFSDSGIKTNITLNPDGGNVGIGTTSPQTKLHIAQSSSAVLFSESSGTATIIGTNAAGTASQGLFLRGYPLTFTGDGGGGSEHMRITSGGNVGIGTISPAQKLQIYDGNNLTAINIYNSKGSSGGTSALMFGLNDGAFVTNDASRIEARILNNPDAALDFKVYGNSLNTVMTLQGNGNVGIGTISPIEKLHVVGNARITGLANASNPVNVQVDVNGVLVRTSSIELKDDVQNLPYGLNEIMLLKPSKFNYKDKYKFGEGYDIGFIAEDVNDVIPEAVGTGVESDIFMDSVKLIPILTKAIQEQQALIKALEQRIINLENK